MTATFAERTGLPLLLLSDEVPLRTGDVRAFFEARVLGQDEAVEAMVDLVTVAKSGLQDPNKPLGSFFFVGPTGVGKTELTKALAEFLFGSSDRVIRFDMAEHGSGDALPRLIGTAWHSNGEGELTRRVREQPFCVLLLDEIEKAHRDVFDALLSALGEGRLTDANGRTADFRNAIVVMTSNLGAGQGSAAVGFSAADAAAEADRLRRHFVEQAEKFFRPEFFNRIDRVLPFHALDPETVRRIARRELGRLLMREGITRRRLLVEIDDAVVERLAESGFHPHYGARPLQREIERAVIQPLARLIVEQRPSAGDLVRFTCDGDEIRVAVQKVEVAEPPRRRERAAASGTEATLARAARRAAELHSAVEAEVEGPFAQSLRTEISALVERTSTPGFWDDAASDTLFQASASNAAVNVYLYQGEKEAGRFTEERVEIADCAPRAGPAADEGVLLPGVARPGAAPEECVVAAVAKVVADIVVPGVEAEESVAHPDRVGLARACACEQIVRACHAQHPVA